jgi:hypothetical protein
MPRSSVDDDFRNHCSYGFHVGTLEYATKWGPRCVLVKVDPADVVSVPSSCECQKLRTSRYTVVCEYQGALTRPLHSASSPYEDDFEDESWEDSEDYETDEEKEKAVADSWDW